VTSQDRERALLAVLDGLYLGLGEAAALVEGDGATVALYEASRTVGGAALAWRERLGDAPSAPLGAVAGALEAAARRDPSGRLALAVASSLVGPRVLISLRDAREERGTLDEAGRAASGVASDAVVAALWRCAAAATALGAGDAGDAGASAGFADLARTLDDEGFGESFR
jgi:hypothetical protein